MDAVTLCTFRTERCLLFTLHFYIAMLVFTPGNIANQHCHSDKRAYSWISSHGLLMTSSFSLGLRRLGISLLIGASALLTGCASFYLDPATRDVPTAEMPKVAQPQPVKLNFEFQTRGAPNSRATEHLQGVVTEQIKASGMFSTLDAAPGGAILDIKLNNIPLTDGSPAAKGFVSGFTLGLVGSSVADGYECKLSYLAPGQTVPIVKLTRHAIHTTLGAANPPPGTVHVDSANEAVLKMTHAIISNALRDLAQDPAFH